MDREIKIRLATIIDCEGSISLYWAKDGEEHYNRPIVTATNKQRVFLEQFQKEFGFGRIGRCGPEMKYYSWVACNIQAYIACLTLLDHFQLKRENAKKIIEYYQNRAKSPTYHLDDKLKRYNTASFISDELQNMKEGEKHG